MRIILFILLYNLNLASAMTFPAESIERLKWLDEKKVYEVVIKNKAAFYKVDQKWLMCLQKGIKEKVELEIDPTKLVILSCK